MMRPESLREALSDMAAQRGFQAAALVELDGGMVWHAEGDAALCDAVVSTVSDYWRLYRRNREVFSPVGELQVAILFHRAARITVSECGPGLILVIITDRDADVDWERWKKAHARLSKDLRAD